MKKFALLVILSLAVSLVAGARDRVQPDASVSGNGKSGARPRFVYDVDFEFRFDNREYDRSSYSPSMTILGARLTPSVGMGIRAAGEHRLMLGIDIMKDFGASPVRAEASLPQGADPEAALPAGETSPSLSNWDLFREIIFYYRWETSFRRTDMTLTAGIFPRSEMSGRYSPAFFSDSLKFYDNNIEGLLLEFRRPNAAYEVGCDWMGQYGQARRERFMIFSSGEARVAGPVLMGYSGYLYHYAGCENVWGVVDNILVNPYAGVDLSAYTGLQSFRIDLGWMQSCQNDRRNVGKYVFPHGAELHTVLGNWNVCIENRLFYGTDMMPYYDSSDASGIKYGNSLYFGEPFYRVSEEHDGPGFYDRMDIYYEPRIASFLALRVGASFHFNEGFSGWQQTVSLRFDLSSLGLDRTMSGRKRK